MINHPWKRNPTLGSPSWTSPTRTTFPAAGREPIRASSNLCAFTGALTARRGGTLGLIHGLKTHTAFLSFSTATLFRGGFFSSQKRLNNCFSNEGLVCTMNSSLQTTNFLNIFHMNPQAADWKKTINSWNIRNRHFPNFCTFQTLDDRLTLKR